MEGAQVCRGQKALNDGPRVALISLLHHHAMITIYYIKGPSCLGGLRIYVPGAAIINACYMTA